MKIGFSTGFAALGNYWGEWPFTVGMMGGSERILTEVAREFAKTHGVVVRLPYMFPPSDDHTRRQWGVTWVDSDSPARDVDILFAVDDYEPRDNAPVSVLVACRSDPPPHTDFTRLIFLSQHHATLMGHPGAPYVGGGVDLADYLVPLPRVPRRVISTSSPDRCPAAMSILRSFDGVHSYRPVAGVGNEMSRADLVALQKTAMVHVYPLDPIRPSDFFSMSVLESMAAGTPVIVSDADAMPELWSDAAVMLARPIRLAEWVETTEDLLANKRLWKRHAELGRKKAAGYTWAKQAAKYLAIAVGD